jgi:hypothetical protein
MRSQTTVVDAPITADRHTDQRQAHRQPSNESAIVSVLGTPDQAVRGEILNISKGGTQLHLDEPLPVGSLISIAYNDNYLLGEVIYCHQKQRRWLVGIQVEHALFGVTAIAAIMNTAR